MQNNASPSGEKRVIKFRGFHKPTGKMIDLKKITPLALTADFPGDGLFIPFSEDVVLMQFTGQQLNGVDIYEGDVIRQELSEETEDRMLWYVVVWIKEWCMFGCLNINEGEYQEYLEGGADKLDESMFWTFPLDTEEKYCKQFLCGNIHEHPHLLTPTNE